MGNKHTFPNNDRIKKESNHKKVKNLESEPAKFRRLCTFKGTWQRGGFSGAFAEISSA
jgi:hypothetical protein